MTREMTIEEIVAQRTQPIITEKVTRMTFAVMGTNYTPEAEHRLYNKLGEEKFYANAAACDFVVAWCNSNKFPWGSVWIESISHYKHGNENGHYCITALIKTREIEETA